MAGVPELQDWHDRVELVARLVALVFFVPGCLLDSSSERL